MEKRRGMGAGAMIEPLYVCVYVPEFPAQALLRLRRELTRSPVVVLDGDPPLEQVCSANRRALRLGVKHGMTSAELDCFTGLCVLRRSSVEEHGARDVLLDTAGLFTPRVEVQPMDGCAFVMTLDMAGSSRLFGATTQVVHSMMERLQALQFAVQLAASANFHAAVCVAPSAKNVPMILSRGKEAEHLGPLPLAVLGLSSQQADTLALWGLNTLGELASLPEVDLVVRLGQEGKRLQLLARGEHPHLMVPEEPVFALEERVEFDAPVELLDSLLFVLGPMLDQLIIRAQNRSLALASVTVKLGLDGGCEHPRTIKPALPVAQREILLKLLHLDLQAHPPPAGVMSVFVGAEPGDRSKVQLGLFAPQLPEPMRLDVTLARIAALVGEARVGRARLLDTHKPDSFIMERFVVPGTKPKEDKSPKHSVAIRRCRPPVALYMQREGNRLGAFTLRGKLYAVQQAYGPWRKSGQWWSSEVWSHEEWDVCGKANSGETLLCLITHDLLRNQWQLEALYD
jgi:protein ImuB